MIKNVQPFQHQVLDNLPQAKQQNLFNKENNSPRFRFNKCFPLSLKNSKQWRPFLPNEGGLIHVDIGGYPPIPIGLKHFFGNLQFLAIFCVLNFQGHFKGLNDDFSREGTSLISKGIYDLVK
jgi:hypothetical protein